MSTTKEFKSQLHELGIDIPTGFGQWPAEAQQAFVESQRALAQAKADAEEARKSATVSRRKLTRREKFRKFGQGDQAELVREVLGDLNSFEKSTQNARKRARYETLRVLACLYDRGELAPSMVEKIGSTFPDA